MAKVLWLKTIPVSIVFITQQAFAQFSDDFSDGDFSINPTWNANAQQLWTVENNRLRSNSQTANSTFYLSTPSEKAMNAQWEFFVNLQFNTSGANYVDIFLTSSTENLNAAGNTGYFVRIGGTPDEVSLYKLSGGTASLLINGTDGVTNKANNTLKIKVIRNAEGQWTLSRDDTGSGHYVEEGSFTDNSFTTSNYFGIRITQSTASFFSKHYFDDLYVGNIILDSAPPEIQSIHILSSTKLEIVFSEETEETAASNTVNYWVDHEVGAPATAVLFPDKKTVHLEFLKPFPNGVSFAVTVRDVTDLFGNPMDAVTRDFLFFQPVPSSGKDIIITEIFPDPTPVIGLPEAEFIEIHNRSENPFDLAGWKITDGSSTGTLSHRILLPGEYLILSSASAQSSFSSFGKTMGVPSFPSLNNSSDKLKLKNELDQVIDSVSYSASWYRDDEKKDGGWSLELIDPDNFCKDDQNWTSSVSASGGTPGVSNSVFAHMEDDTGPRLVSLDVVDLRTLEIEFDEALNASEPSVSCFGIIPSITVTGVSFQDESLTKIRLELAQEPDSTKIYTVTVKDIFDCPGNRIQPDFSAGSFKLDRTPPAVKTIAVTSDTEIIVEYSEKMRSPDVETIQNYDAGPLEISSVVLQTDQKKVMVVFSKPLVNGVEQTLRIKNVKDLSENTIAPVETRFLFFEPVPAKQKDIIITEIMADPSPGVGLPEAEFVEIYNRSGNPFDLAGWKISDGNNEGVLPGIMLLPKEYAVLCAGSGAMAFSSFGKIVSSASFPSLNNSGDRLVLKAPDGLTVDSVNYSDKWYHDDEKKDGGWTLELIDPENICAEASNWTAAEAVQGGTPGTQNSVYAEKPDLTGPKLLSAFPESKDRIILRFDEKLEKKNLTAENFQIIPRVKTSSAVLDLTLASIQLGLAEELSGGLRYEVAVSHVYDCPGNEVQPEYNRAAFALPEIADSLDVVINEVLFNPRPTGVDFIEIVNTTAKFINLKNWKVGNIGADAPVNLKVISEENLLLEPNTYRVLTEAPDVLKGEYIASAAEASLKTDLPPLPDDEGSIVILDDQENVIDSFSYSDNMHSVFVKDTEGVSLERIRMRLPENRATNWKSASAASGFATPGYVNSNVRTESVPEESVQIEPEIFIPVYGQPDFAEIKYSFEQGGMVASIRILDSQGREIKRIANNETLSTNGFYRWDGDQDNGSKARIGPYMVWVEVFDASGKVKVFRKRVVVAGEF